MIMKKILYYSFIILALISCNDEDFLDLLPKHTSTVDNYYVDTPGFEAALNGLYATVRNVYQSGHINYALWHTGTDYAMNGTQPTGHMVSAGTYKDFTPNTGAYRLIWTWGYEVISKASYIIDYAENEDIEWALPTDKNRVVAEAKFMRAYAYKFLVWTFGDIPLVKEAITKAKTDFTRDPVADIWAFIREDLEFAVEYLPETTDKSGKLVKAAAQHFLAETYLTLGEDALAEQIAQKVVDNPNYGLIKERFGTQTGNPGDYYHDLFDYHNQNDPNNIEAIWVTQFELDITGGNETVDVTGRMWTPTYHRVKGIANTPTKNGPATSRLWPTDYMVDLYEEGDIRFSDYNWQKKYYYDDAKNLPAGANLGDEVPVTDANKKFLYPHPLKWFFPYHPTNAQYSQNRHDRYEIRLAETYLLLAEAQFNQGKLDLAAQNINVVRERANATPISGSDVTLDFILDERARELIGEYPRRFTLLRTGTLLERVRKYNPEGGSAIQEMHKVFPIPQMIIDANIDAEFPQNPGYETLNQ
jgi:hypothetical protein